jgi:sec-independent protein translocase protein TatB
VLDLGTQELIVIFIVALLVVGPKKLPELARKMGKGVSHLKSAMSDIKSEVDREMNAVDEDIVKDIPSWKTAISNGAGAEAGDSFKYKINDDYPEGVAGQDGEAGKEINDDSAMNGNQSGRTVPSPPGEPDIREGG